MITSLKRQLHAGFLNAESFSVMTTKWHMSFQPLPPPRPFSFLFSTLPYLSCSPSLPSSVIARGSSSPVPLLSSSPPSSLYLFSPMRSTLFLFFSFLSFLLRHYTHRERRIANAFSFPLAKSDAPVTACPALGLEKELKSVQGIEVRYRGTAVGKFPEPFGFISRIHLVKRP